MGWHYPLAQLAEIIGAALPPAAPEATFSAVSTDTRSLQPGQVFFALSGDHFDGNRFVEDALQRGAAAVVTQREEAGRPFLTVPDPLQALQQFAAWHRRQCRARIIAITGSCGKTTAKNLTAALLETRYRTVKTQGNLNNEIGCPLSLLQMTPDTEYMVLELGANHAGEIARMCALARPDESAITMVAPAHLEGFGSIERVALAKAEIMEALPPDGLFYVNTGNSWCVQIGARYPGRKTGFGDTGEVALKHCAFNAAGELELDIAPVGRLTLPLPIRAHATNVLLAVAIGLEHGITEFEAPLRAACAGAARFQVKHIGHFTVLDDTYNASPASMLAALEALAERPGGGQRIAALGEMLELGDEAETLHAEVGTFAAKQGISHLFARGPHARATIAAAQAAHLPHAAAIEEHAAIAEAIRAVVQPGDTVLVKGSRGMRMEKVIDALAAHFAPEP